MLFLRSDLAHLTAYTPHPGGEEPIDMIIDHLDTNECPYDLPEALKQKLVWHYQNIIKTNRYPDGSHHELKEAIASYVNENIELSTAQITAEHISVGNGSDELIRAILIATCLLDEGAVLVADPTFSMYAILAKTLGISVAKVGRSIFNFSINLEDAQKEIDAQQEPQIRVVFVVHPNSPTGNALTKEELEWLQSLPRNILVVIDEAYYEFSQITLAGALKKHPNWVILRTFSKAFRLASLRVGYAIGHPEFINALEKIRLPYNIPGFSQAAALMALHHRSELLTVIPEIISERDKLIQALSSHPELQIWPSAGNFIYARLKGANHSDQALHQLMQELKAKGTLIRHTGGGLRITIGTPEENARTLARLFNH